MIHFRAWLKGKTTKFWGYIDNIQDSENYKEAKALYDKKDYKGAARRLEKVLAKKVDPASPETKNHIESYLGASYFLSGDYNEALKHFQDCIDLSEDNKVALSDSHSNIAAVLGQIGLNSQAIVHLRQAQANDPKDPVNSYNLGVAYLALGKYEDSLGEFYKAAEQYKSTDNPLDSDTFNNIAWTLYKLERYDEALSNCETSLAIDRDQNHEAYDTYARILYAIGRNDQALLNIEKAISINPNLPFYYATKASILMTLDRIGESVESLDQMEKTLLSEGPQSYSVLDSKGREELQSITNSIRQLKEAVSNSEAEADILNSLVAEYGLNPSSKDSLQSLIDNAVISSQIPDDVKKSKELSGYWFGFKATLSQVYTTSQVVKDGNFVLKTDIGVKLVAGAASFIPLAGPFLQSGIEGGATFAKTVQESQRANKFLNIAADHGELSQMTSNMVKDILQNSEKKDWIKQDNPEAADQVSGWWNKFLEKVKLLKGAVEVSVYGTPYDTIAKKKGTHDACKVIKHWMDIYKAGEHFPEKSEMLVEHLLGDNICIRPGDTDME